MSFPELVNNLEDILSKLTLPCIVKIEKSPEIALEQSKLHYGEIVQLCELRTIQVVTGHVTDGLKIAGNRLEPDNFQIVIPLSYPASLKLLHEIKSYSLISDIYKDSPRYFRIKEKLVVPQGGWLLTFDEDTVVEVLCRLQGAQRAFNKRDVDMIRVDYAQHGHHLQADIPVNTRGVFRSEPDGTQYTIVEATNRYTLPNVAAFESTFLRELFAEIFPGREKELLIPDTVRLDKIDKKEVLVFCKLSKGETGLKNPQYFALPTKSFECVKVRVIQESDGSRTPYQIHPFKDDSGYKAALQQPWLIDLRDDDYEPMAPSDEEQGDNYNEAGHQQCPLPGLDDDNYEPVSPPNLNKEEKSSTPRNQDAEEEHDGGDSDSCGQSYDKRSDKEEAHNATGKSASFKKHGALTRVESVLKKIKKIKNVTKIFRSASSSSASSISPPPSPLSPTAAPPTFQPHEVNLPRYTPMRTNVTHKPEEPEDELPVDDFYDEINDSEVGQKIAKASRPWQKKDDRCLYPEAEEEEYGKILNTTETEESVCSDDGYLLPKGKVKMKKEDSHFNTTDTDDSDEYERMCLTPKSEDKIKDFDKLDVDELCERQKSEDKIKDFDKLDVDELCERLDLCGLGKLAKVTRSKFYDGHDLNKMDTHKLLKEPFMLTEFEVHKFERVKTNWVPNL